MSIFPRKRSLRKKLRRLFGLQKSIVSVNLPAQWNPEPQGIVRTVFEDAVVNYFEPVMPADVHTTQQCLVKFGRKQPVQFKQLTTAVNQFKS